MSAGKHRKKVMGSFQAKKKINKIERLFKKDFGVTKKQLEEYAGRNLADFGAEECTDLWGVYTALKNGQAKVEDYFKIEQEVPDIFEEKKAVKEEQPQ